MDLFVTYVIVSSLFWAIFTFVSKYILTNRMKNFISFTYLQGILIVIIFPILSFLIVPDQVFLPPLTIAPYALISGGTSILAYLLMYYGLHKYDASSATPIIGTTAIFVIPLTYFLLGEFYGVTAILWILIAMSGAIITTWDENMKAKQLLSFKNKAFWIFLSVAFLYASGNVAVKPAVKLVSNYNFLIWREFAWFAVLLILTPFIFRKRERESFRADWRSAILLLAIAVSMLYFMYILMFYALGVSVQIAQGLSASSGIFAVIIGFLVSKTSLNIEPRHAGKIYATRIVGALMILLAIYNLSFVL